MSPIKFTYMNKQRLFNFLKLMCVIPHTEDIRDWDMDRLKATLKEWEDNKSPESIMYANITLRAMRKVKTNLSIKLLRDGCDAHQLVQSV